MSAGPVIWRWGDVDALVSGDDLCLVHRYADARVLVRDGRLRRGPGYERVAATARREVARVGAIVRLRQRERYFVHAAGAVDPSGRAWLLTGDSGSGKSTLAYALARSGWTVLGDDGVLLSVAGADVTVHPWHAPLEVSSALVSAFPELRVQLPRARAGDARRRIPVDVPRAAAAPLAAVVFLERADHCALTTEGPLAALASLVRQSPWVIIDDECARPHLDALRRTAHLPSFRFAHTPAELHTVAETLTTALL